MVVLTSIVQAIHYIILSRLYQDMFLPWLNIPYSDMKYFKNQFNNQAGKIKFNIHRMRLIAKLYFGISAD